MASKRERVTGDRVEEEGVDLELKRQRVDQNSSPSPPSVSIANPLSGLANNYAAIDEEEDYYQRDKGAVTDNRNGGSQQNGHKYEGDEDSDEEDDSGKQLFAGRYSRQVEVRRDCPYLDTVNRQVFYLFCPL